MTTRSRNRKVEAAIKATEQKSAPGAEQLDRVKMRNLRMHLLGVETRPAAILVPEDLTDIELENMIVNLIVFMDQLRAERRLASPLVVARTMPVSPTPLDA